MSKVRLGIIGIGNMGSGHVESILDGKVPEIELAAVADLREVRRQWARETVPETVKIFETAEELLDDSDLDAVLVAVPHYDHPRYVIQALRRGFHVMCRSLHKAGSGDERGGKQTRSGIRHDVQSENEPYLPEDA
jgi:predicted dehydrogenase